MLTALFSAYNKHLLFLRNRVIDHLTEMLIWLIFTTRQHAERCTRLLAIVNPSVCPSVRHRHEHSLVQDFNLRSTIAFSLLLGPIANTSSQPDNDSIFTTSLVYRYTTLCGRPWSLPAVLLGVTPLSSKSH